MAHLPPWQAWSWTLVFCALHGLPYALFEYLSARLRLLESQLGAVLAAAALTVIRLWYPHMFPGSEANSLSPWPVFIQVLDLGGVPLLLFCIYLVNFQLVRTIIGWRSQKFWGPALACAAAVLLVLALAPSPCLAASSYSISNTYDNGSAGSLRERIAAINSAGASTSPTTLYFNSGIGSSISLTGGSLPTILRPISIANDNGTDITIANSFGDALFKADATLSIGGTSALILNSTYSSNAWGIGATGDLTLGSFGSLVSINTSTTADRAYGIYSPGNMSITSGMAGTISATAGTHTAIGILSGGTLNGGSASTAASVTGSVYARANGLAVAVASAGAMNLKVTGTLSGVDTSGAGRGYAIRAGSPDESGGWTTGSANNIVTLDTGAALVGKVDLGTGANTLNLYGIGSTSSQLTGVGNLVLGDGTTAATWTLSPSATSAVGLLTLNSGTSLTINDYVTLSAVLNSGGTLTLPTSTGLKNYGGGSLSLTSLTVPSGSSLSLAGGTTITTTNADLSATATYNNLGSAEGTSTITSPNPITVDGGATGFTKGTSTFMTSSVFTLAAGSSTATFTTSRTPLEVIVGGNGGALDTLRRTATTGSSLASLFDTLYTGISRDQVRGATQQLSGEGVVNTPMLVSGQVAAFRSAVGQQQGRFSSGPGGTGLAANSRNGSSLIANGFAASSGSLWSTLGNAGAQDGDSGLAITLVQMMTMSANNGAGRASAGLAARGQVQQLHQGANGGYSGYNGELGLAALGYDAPVTNNLRLGVGFGHSGGQLRGAGVTTNLHTWFASLYGTLALPQEVKLDADLTYGYTHAKLDGTYNWPVADSTTGRYTANTYSGSIKASRDLLPFGDNGLRLTPSVALEAAQSVREAFTESGSTLTKHFGGSTMNTLDVPFGAAISRDFDYGKGTFSPEISAYYVRRLADTRATSNVTLQDGATSSSVSGASADRNLLRANLGGRITTQENMDFSLFYNGEFGDHYANNGMTLEVKYSF